MSTLTTSRPGSAEPAAPAVLPPIRWRDPVLYAVLTVVGLLLAVTTGAGETSTFSFGATDWVAVPNWAVPAAAAVWLLALVMAALTAYAVRRAVARARTGWWVGAVFGVAFIVAFLVWIGSGRTTLIPVTSLLGGALALSVPLVFGALSGVMCERSGVINIAIEGQLLGGAFLAAVVASAIGNPYAGVVAAPVAGALVGVLLVFFGVRYWVDQIIVGVVLNVLVTGLTSFLFSTVLTEVPGLNDRYRLPALPVPVLSEIPVVGPVLFDQNLLVYLMYAAVAVLSFMLFRSRWGLRVRAVGEHPRAADTVGINVIRTRWVTPIMGGALAGLGGAFFTVGSGLAFGKDMSAGNGFIALAAMILGKWNPLGALGAALLFGFSRNLANVLSTIGAGVPGEFLLMLPYVVTIFAVAGFVGRVRAPAAENQPYLT